MIKYFTNLFKALLNKETTLISVKEVIKEVRVEVLSPDAINRLSSKMEPPVITGSDTEHTTAYKLGIQRCIQIISKGV